MKKKEYTKPQIDLVIMSDLLEGDMREGSWGVDGSHKPIDEAGGDEIDVLGKDNGNLWDGWDD